MLPWKSVARVQNISRMTSQEHASEFTDIGLSRKTVAPAAIFRLRFCSGPYRKWAQNFEEVRNVGSIDSLRSPRDQGATCAKSGSDLFRNVDLYKFHTNKQIFIFINKVMITLRCNEPVFILTLRGCLWLQPIKNLLYVKSCMCHSLYFSVQHGI
jgi:hypothetical protein